MEAQKEGLDYPTTQRGGNLSGGQKQRLAIARALLKPAAIYIFDDSLDVYKRQCINRRKYVNNSFKTEVNS